MGRPRPGARTIGVAVIEHEARSRCPVCGEPTRELLAEGRDFEYDSMPGPFRVWRCAGCGHGYLDPLPARSMLGTIYPPTYYTLNPESPIHFAGPVAQLKLRRDLDRIQSLVGDRPIGSVLDVGCGDGERLARLGERLGGGVDLVGVDFQPDPERLPELALRGVRVIQADVEDGLDALDDGSLDVIIMCQLIEHLRDPASAIQALVKKLAPQGRLLIETPNQAGWDFRFFRGSHWGGYHFPRHFHVFTTGSLELLLHKTGFDVVRQGSLPSGFGIVSLRNRLGLSSARRGDGFGEFLHMRNLPVVGAFVAIEQLWMLLGWPTSNQYVLAERR